MLLQDLRQAFQTLASRPGFTAAAILSLAVGIGAETSVYALIRALFDRPPMDVAEPHEIVAISSAVKGQPVEDAIRFPDYRYLRDHNTVFSALASHFNSGVGLFESERAEILNGHVVSADYFAVLGLTPRLGRFFLPEQDRVPGRDAVVVLSYAYWQRRFRGDARALGQTITLNGVRFAVTGHRRGTPAHRSAAPDREFPSLADRKRVRADDRCARKPNARAVLRRRNRRRATSLFADARLAGLRHELVIVTGVAFGLVPALQASSPALVPAIKQDPASQGLRGHGRGAFSLSPRSVSQ